MADKKPFAYMIQWKSRIKKYNEEGWHAWQNHYDIHDSLKTVQKEEKRILSLSTKWWQYKIVGIFPLTKGKKIT